MSLPRKPIVSQIPSGEASVIYTPTSLAQSITNFERYSEGGSKYTSLKSINGPMPFEPDRGQGYQTLGKPFSIFHGRFGPKDILLGRFGTRLYRHCGWTRNWVEIASGFDNDTRPKTPEMFCRLGDLVVFCNGVDRPRVIKMDGDARVYPLGFTNPPSSPTANGPSPLGSTSTKVYENYFGYSRPGNIGSVGDVADNNTGWLLDGQWYYWVQDESVTGDLGPLSPMSNPVTLYRSLAQPFYAGGDATLLNCATVDDLRKQFLVEVQGTTETHVKGKRVYRSMDTKRNPSEARFLTYIEGVGDYLYPDNKPDSMLGEGAQDCAPVGNIRVMCAHQGRLAMVTTEESDIVRLSEPGLPGTYLKQNWIKADSSGAEITALASHNGKLIAFTENCIYDISDLTNSTPIAQGIGCIAPKSIVANPDGSLIWLSRDGFYKMGSNYPQPISLPIEYKIKKRLSKTRMRMASAAFDYSTFEYRIAITSAGKYSNDLVLTYDGNGWKQLDLGITFADLCCTQDSRRLFLGIGNDSTNNFNSVFVFGREARTYNPPDRSASYQSNWIRNDEMGITPLHVRGLYVQMVDTYNDIATISIRKNYSYEIVSSQQFKLYGADEFEDDGPGVSITNDFVDEALIGTSKLRTGRLFWRWIPVDIQDAYAWSFEIVVDYPARIHITAFAYDSSEGTNGSVYPGRIPGGND